MEKLLTLKEAAELLHVNKETLRIWERKGHIKSIRTPGNHRRYDMRDIEEFLNNHK